MNATERHRQNQRRQLVDLSIQLHGGPYGPCPDCREAEDLTLKALHLGAADWERESSAWHRHLALD